MVEYIDPIFLIISIGVVSLISFLRFNQWTEFGETFARRYSPVHYTSYSAFIKYQTAYVLLNLISYVILVSFPGVAAMVIKHLASTSESSGMMDKLLSFSAGSTELFLLLLFLVLPDYNKRIKQIENTIRERLQSKAGIPTKVMEFICHNLFDPQIFKPQEEAVEEFLQEKRKLNLKRESLSLDQEQGSLKILKDFSQITRELNRLWAQENFLLFRIKQESGDSLEQPQISTTFDKDYQAVEVLLQALEGKIREFYKSEEEGHRNEEDRKEDKEEIVNLASVVRAKLKSQLQEIFIYISIGRCAFTELSQGNPAIYWQFGIFPKYKKEPFFDWTLLARTAAVLFIGVFFSSFAAFTAKNLFWPADREEAVLPNGAWQYWYHVISSIDNLPLKKAAIKTVPLKKEPLNYGLLFGKSLKLTLSATVGFFLPVMFIFFFYDLMSGQQLLTEVGSRFFRRPSVHVAWYLFGFIIGYFVLLITLEVFYSTVDEGFSHPDWALMGGLTGIWALIYIRKFLHLPEEPWNIKWFAIFQGISFSLAALLISSFKNDFEFKNASYPIISLSVSFVVGLILGSVVPWLMHKQYLRNLMNTLDRRRNKRINLKLQTSLQIAENSHKKRDDKTEPLFDEKTKCTILNLSPDGVAVQNGKKAPSSIGSEAKLFFPRIGEVVGTIRRKSDSQVYIEFHMENERLSEIQKFYRTLVGERYISTQPLDEENTFLNQHRHSQSSAIHRAHKRLLRERKFGLKTYDGNKACKYSRK